MQFALRSLKVVVKTNDKSQLTSRLPSDQPNEATRPQNASKQISRFGVLETDRTASKAFSF